MSCVYRVQYFKSDEHLCGCPLGQHAMGRNCVDNRRRCSVARKQDRQFAKVERQWQAQRELRRFKAKLEAEDDHGTYQQAS